MRKIDVPYVTAWFVLYRLRSAMGQRESSHLLQGVIEDDAYYGGEGHGRVGRGTQRPKALVAISVRSGGAPLHLKIGLVPDFTQDTTNQRMASLVEAGALIRSDGLNAFGALEQAGFRHEAVPTRHLPEGSVPGAAHPDRQQQSVDRRHLPRPEPQASAVLPGRILLQVQSPPASERLRPTGECHRAQPANMLSRHAQVPPRGRRRVGPVRSTHVAQRPAGSSLLRHTCTHRRRRSGE